MLTPLPGGLVDDGHDWVLSHSRGEVVRVKRWPNHSNAAPEWVDRVQWDKQASLPVDAMRIVLKKACSSALRSLSGGNRFLWVQSLMEWERVFAAEKASSPVWRISSRRLPVFHLVAWKVKVGVAFRFSFPLQASNPLSTSSMLLKHVRAFKRR